MGGLKRQVGLRPAFFFLSGLLLLFVALCLCLAHSRLAAREGVETSRIREATVAVVGSADLAVNNAARYIRHVSLTDVSTPFQDCPACFDYFPASLSTRPPKFFGIVTRFERVKP